MGSEITCEIPIKDKWEAKKWLAVMNKTVPVPKWNAKTMANAVRALMPTGKTAIKYSV